MKAEFLGFFKKVGVVFAALMLMAGFLFSALPVSAQTAQAAVDLTARNLNRPGASDWSKSVLVGPSDQIEFSIQLRTIGAAPLYNCRVTVDLFGELNYILNSGRINGAQLADGITGYSGLNLGTLLAGETKNIIFRAQISRNYFYGGSVILNPYVNVRADNLSSAVQGRMEIIAGNQTAGTSINYSNDFYPIIYIEKRGANVSRGDLDYSYTTYASPGEIVEFAIKAKSSSNTLGILSGIWVSDRLPPEMTYVNNSTFIDGLAAADGIASGGIEIGTLAKGQTKTIKFRARISPMNLTSGETIGLANYASARSAGAKTLAETDALIVVSRDKYSSPAAAAPTAQPAVPAKTPDSNGEVLGAATVKTGPSQTIVIVSVFSLIISLFAYRKFRRDKILRPFKFWNDWQLKRNLRRLRKEK